MTTEAYPWSAGFRSLSEEHDYRIEEIDGQVPATLRGTLFRNGSGRNQLGGEWFPHWFDGDGMIAALRFGDDGIRFLLVSGKPLQEPVAWYGPIVMNTQDQLRQAYEELDKGTFLKAQ